MLSCKNGLSLPVSHGRTTHILFEEIAEMLRFGKAQLNGYLLDGKIGKFKITT
jgi:hypothetical protein